MSNTYEPQSIMLPAVRIGYPKLFEKAKFKEKETGYSAKLLLDKVIHKNLIEKIQEEVIFIGANFLNKPNIIPSSTCLRDCEEYDNQNFENCFVLSANNKNQPTVYDSKGDLIHNKEDCNIYAGCHVNAIVSLHNANTASRVIAILHTVRFHSDGERFSSYKREPEENYRKLLFSV